MAKVLLVEDDNNLREIYQARLMAEGYEIIAAQNGEEALVLAKQNKPDLIISDVMMPRISGFEMLDILRNTEELKKTKIIMLTALGQDEDQKRASGLGADKYLVKSQVTLEDIVNAAKQLLEGDSGIAGVPPAQPLPDPIAMAGPGAQAVDPAASATPADTLAPVPAPTPASDIMAPAAPDIPAISHTPLTTAPDPAGATPVDPAPSPDPAAPTAAPLSTPDPAAMATPDPATPTPDPQSASVAANDQTLAEAVEQLNQAIAEPALPPVPEPTTQPAPAMPEPVASAPEVIQPAPAPTPEPTPTDDSSAAPGSRKVIQPLEDGASRPDLSALLAQEEANAPMGATPAMPIANPGVPVVSDHSAEANTMSTAPVSMPEPAQPAPAPEPAVQPAPAMPEPVASESVAMPGTVNSVPTAPAAIAPAPAAEMAVPTQMPPAAAPVVPPALATPPAPAASQTFDPNKAL